MRSFLVWGMALHWVACTPGVSPSSASGSGGAAASNASGTTTATASSGTGVASTGSSTCPAQCAPPDSCHGFGKCDPMTGMCAYPVTCTGGKVCQGGSCVCAAGQLFCPSKSQCEDVGTACTDIACGLCGADAACDGLVVYDSVSQFNTTCTSVLGTCDAQHAQASNAPDQQHFHDGRNNVCLKDDGVYGWHRRILSASLGGIGCTVPYGHCTYICSAPLNYAAYCDMGGNFDTNLSSAGSDGCSQLVPVPPSYTCP